MPTPTIRPLAAADRAAWDPLWAGYLAYYKENLPAHVTEETWRRLLDPAVDPHGIVAVDADGRLVGIGAQHPHVDAEADGSLVGHARQLAAADDADGSGHSAIGHAATSWQAAVPTIARSVWPGSWRWNWLTVAPRAEGGQG